MNTALVVSQILLWLAVAGLVVVVIALARQVGVLFERVAPAGALALNSRIKVGEPAPPLSAPTLDGGMVDLAAKQSRSRLLFFLAPDCPICKSLLPSLKSARNSESDWLDIILASDGDPAQHRVFVEREGLKAFPYVVSEPLGRAFGVSKLPYGVLIDEAGRIASFGIVNSREHLESLFEAKERGIGSIQEYLNNRTSAEGGKHGHS
jgi:methylamine dehydrogenase accessory protein MauD